jgi:2-furoate---CoA ligase
MPASDQRKKPTWSTLNITKETEETIVLDLGRTFLQSVERNPDALAVVDGEQRLSYAQWYDRIQRVADGLATLGLGRGDHLMIVLQNRIEMATLHWACQFLGVIATPLNWRAKPDEVEYCAIDSQARAIACEPTARTSP